MKSSSVMASPWRKTPRGISGIAFFAWIGIWLLVFLGVRFFQSVADHLEHVGWIAAGLCGADGGFGKTF
ncbi:hypothetical protein D3C78_1930680 [compost metagenome]